MAPLEARQPPCLPPQRYGEIDRLYLVSSVFTLWQAEALPPSSSAGTSYRNGHTGTPDRPIRSPSGRGGAIIIRASFARTEGKAGKYIAI